MSVHAAVARFCGQFEEGVLAAQRLLAEREAEKGFAGFGQPSFAQYGTVS